MRSVDLECARAEQHSFYTKQTEPKEGDRNDVAEDSRTPLLKTEGTSREKVGEDVDSAPPPAN